MDWLWQEQQGGKPCVKPTSHFVLRGHSIYYHTHTYFLRHSHVEQLYPNDFAQWVAMEVRDHILGERLAVVDPFEFTGLESLREEFISVIDDHLSRTTIVPRESSASGSVSISPEFWRCPQAYGHGPYKNFAMPYPKWMY